MEAILETGRRLLQFLDSDNKSAIKECLLLGNDGKEQ